MAPQQSDKKTKEMIRYLLSYDTETYFTQKEFEKKCPVKLPSNMMKVTLDTIMVDFPFLLDSGKCGNLNIYFVYPHQNMRRVIEESMRLEHSIEASGVEIVQIKSDIEQGKEDRNDFTGKDAKLQQYNELKQTNRELSKKIASLEKTNLCWDQEKIEDELKGLVELRFTEERVTNNIEILISYLCNKYNISSSLLRKELEIPEEL